MLFRNGTIEACERTGGGIDPATGYAIPPEAHWGAPIPCQFRNTAMNLLAQSNGEATATVTLEIIIEAQRFDAERIRLTDAWGTVMGEYSIYRVEPLLAVQKLRLWV